MRRVEAAGRKKGTYNDLRCCPWFGNGLFCAVWRLREFCVLFSEGKKWDFYLLANDDTFAFDTLFDELFASHQYCLSHYGRAGLYSGVTCKPGHPDVTTYGGDKVDWLCRLHRVKPNGQPQPVDEANANLLLVPAEVVEQIGIFYEGYTHSSADYDYTRQAVKHHIPVLITGNNCGECDYDHDSGKIEGDSEVDFQTAQNACLPCISVLWGFRDKEFLEHCGANIYADFPKDILDWLEQKNYQPT